MELRPAMASPRLGAHLRENAAKALLGKRSRKPGTDGPAKPTYSERIGVDFWIAGQTVGESRTTPITLKMSLARSKPSVVAPEKNGGQAVCCPSSVVPQSSRPLRCRRIIDADGGVSAS